jgi:hypothetical protein
MPVSQVQIRTLVAPEGAADEEHPPVSAAALKPAAALRIVRLLSID